MYFFNQYKKIIFNYYASYIISVDCKRIVIGWQSKIHFQYLELGKITLYINGIQVYVGNIMDHSATELGFCKYSQYNSYTDGKYSLYSSQCFLLKVNIQQDDTILCSTNHLPHNIQNPIKYRVGVIFLTFNQARKIPKDFDKLFFV